MLKFEKDPSRASGSPILVHLAITWELGTKLGGGPLFMSSLCNFDTLKFENSPRSGASKLF